MFEPTTEVPQIIALASVMTVALVNDILFRRIPNGVILIGLVAGVALQMLAAGPFGLLIATAGTVVGFGCLLPFYISGGMGAGDVKLMAMAGAFLGPLYAALAAVTSLFVGGFIGVLWFFWHYFSAKDAPLVTNVESAVSEAHARYKTRATAIPYALAIYAGVFAAIAVIPGLLSGTSGGIY